MKRFDLAILVTSVGLVCGIGGFAIGHFTAPKAAALATSGSGGSGSSGGFGGGGRFGGQRPVFGTVASISGDTITVNDTRSGQTETVDVTSSTTYTDGSGGGASESLASISDGTTIAATGTTTSGTMTATRVIVNPSFGGGGGASSSSGGSGAVNLN
jgi:hypothetical protein